MSTQHELLDTAIKQVGNRYLATMLVAKRIRQLYHGSPSYVKREEGESYFTVALREIAEGHVILKEHAPTDALLSEYSALSESMSMDEASQASEPPVDTVQE